MILAWGSNEAAPRRDRGPEAATSGNALYYLPTRLEVSGTTTFTTDLIRSTVVDADADVFGRIDPIGFGRGSADARLPPRRPSRAGTHPATGLTIGLNFGDQGAGPGSRPRSSRLPEIPAGL